MKRDWLRAQHTLRVPLPLGKPHIEISSPTFLPIQSPPKLYTSIEGKGGSYSTSVPFSCHIILLLSPEVSRETVFFCLSFPHMLSLNSCVCRYGVLYPCVMDLIVPICQKGSKGSRRVSRMTTPIQVVTARLERQT